jgi:hypothetical protein
MERRLGEVEARLEELAHLRRDLIILVAAAQRSDLEDCPPAAMYSMLTAAESWHGAPARRPVRIDTIPE